VAKILIADDDATLCEMLRAAFEPDGHEVSFAEEGEAALGMIRDNSYDLVLLDYAMPAKSALQILSQLRLENALMPPTMILSSKVSHELVRECLDAGAKDFVIKPFNLPTLVQRANALIEKGRWRPPSSP